MWLPDRQVLRAVLNVGELAAWEEEEPADEVYEADQSTWLAGMADGLLGAALSLDDPTLAADDRRVPRAAAEAQLRQRAAALRR